MKDTKDYSPEFQEILDLNIKNYSPEYQEILASMPEESIIGRVAKYQNNEYLIIDFADDAIHFVLKNLSNGGGFAIVQWGNFELLPEDYLVGRLAYFSGAPAMIFRVSPYRKDLMWEFIPVRGLGKLYAELHEAKILPALSTADVDDLFDRVVEWNKKRGNTTGTVFNEAKMLFEEVLELCGYSREDAKRFSIRLANEHAEEDKTTVLTVSSEVRDRVIDAATDLIFISIGTILKAGGDPKGALKKVCDANDWKGSKRDATGKIIKDFTFVEPVHVEK